MESKVASEEYEDEVEEVEADDREQSREVISEKARRQLRRGKLSELAEKLTGDRNVPVSRRLHARQW